MRVNTDKPSVRMEESNSLDEWAINTDLFGEGPDNWSSDSREGWRFYLVESIPYRDIYALCRYSWKTDREDVIEEIGHISLDSNLEKSNLNQVLEDNDVETVSDGQYRKIKSAVDNCLKETVRNATLSKGFEIFDHSLYAEFDNPNEYLALNLERLNDDSDEMEELTEEQEESLDLVWNAIEKPNKGSLTRVKHCQIAGSIEFTTLRPFQLRAIELVHNGVFNNHQAVAVVQALKEEGLSQRDIADTLGKDESTVSNQAKIARELTDRARWHSHHVTTDTK